MWGHQVFLKMKSRFGLLNVAGTIRKPIESYQRMSIFQGSPVFDRTDFHHFQQATEVLNRWQPEVVMNCVGLTPRKHNVKNETAYRRINSEFPHHLLDWCQQHSAKLVHFSTDCVFSGQKGSEYTEADKPDATDVYGSSKAAGEIQDSACLTLRLSKIGREIEHKTEILEWFLAQRGKKVQGYTKAYYSGVTTNLMAHEMVRLMEKYPSLNGLYQVSGERISKYELLKLFDQIFETQVEITPNTAYSVDKSLDCGLYCQKTSFQRPKWMDMLVQLKKESGSFYDSQL